MFPSLSSFCTSGSVDRFHSQRNLHNLRHSSPLPKGRPAKLKKLNAEVKYDTPTESHRKPHHTLPVSLPPSTKELRSREQSTWRSKKTSLLCACEIIIIIRSSMVVVVVVIIVIIIITIIIKAMIEIFQWRPPILRKHNH